MSDQPIINVVYNRLPDDLQHPCDRGMHLAAETVDGLVVCARCGGRV